MTALLGHVLVRRLRRIWVCTLLLSRGWAAASTMVHLIGREESENVFDDVDSGAGFFVTGTRTMNRPLASKTVVSQEA